MPKYTKGMRDKNIPPEVGCYVIYYVKEHSLSMTDEKRKWCGKPLKVVSNQGLTGSFSVLVSDDFTFSDVVDSSHFMPLPDTRKSHIEDLVSELSNTYLGYI